MSMTYEKGTKGSRRKKEVKLSVGMVFLSLCVHVWEDDKITHTFHIGKEFAEKFCEIAKLLGIVLPAQEPQQKEQGKRLYPCCDDPDCSLCYGSGIVEGLD